jgi:hypothetical protein
MSAILLAFAAMSRRNANLAAGSGRVAQCATPHFLPITFVI